jgi:hypothetical protein
VSKVVDVSIVGNELTGEEISVVRWDDGFVQIYPNGSAYYMHEDVYFDSDAVFLEDRERIQANSPPA